MQHIHSLHPNAEKLKTLLITAEGAAATGSWGPQDNGAHLKHGTGDLLQVAAQEARMRLGNLNEQLQGLLRGTLIPGLQCVPDQRQLPWDC